MAERQTPTQRLLGDFAPKMVQLTDDVLFGDIWKRPGLSPATAAWSPSPS
jgi:4-carboxymuconolactone decarboxylase